MATYSDDAGIIDLEALRDEARSSGEPSSEQRHFVSPLELPPPLTWIQLMTSPSQAPPARTVQPAHDSVPALASSLAPPATTTPLRRTGLAIGVTLTLAALAGGVLLYARARPNRAASDAPSAASPERTRHVDVALAPVRPASNARVGHALVAAPRHAGPTSSKRAQEHHSTRSSETTARPVASTPIAVPVAPAPVAEPVAPAPVAEPVAPAPVAEPVAPAPVAEPVAELAAAELAPEPAPVAERDLASAMRSAVEEPGERARAEASVVPRASPRQLRPAAGALTSATRAVMPRARACLASDPRIRTGRVVFQSDGSVARVELDGSSAEDECIRSALASAKIDPFVEAPFTMRITVRP